MTIICPKILILYLFEVLAFCCHVTISLNRCHSVHVPGKSIAISTAEGAEFVFQSLDWSFSMSLGSLLRDWNTDQRSNNNTFRKMGGEGIGIKIDSPASRKHGFASQSDSILRDEHRVARGRLWLGGTSWMALKPRPFRKTMGRGSFAWSRRNYLMKMT